MSPDDYKPTKPCELIGPARAIARDLLADAEKISRLLLYGPPGVGKSRVAWMMAQKISQSFDIEKVNGRNVSVDLVREWQRNGAYGSLFGGFKVKLIEETDLIAQVAQDVMLTYLDDLPQRNCVIGTSNTDLATLTERFQTRFRLVKVNGPDSDLLRRWLITRWRLPKHSASFIALAATGNVRAALLDAGKFQTHGTTEHRPVQPTVMKDPKAVASAQKAWVTIREKNNQQKGAA
jgi:DNA polymerase III delta prime subunit